jgi:hypothetical protein
VVPVVGHDSDDIIGGGPHDHLANLEKLGNISDDSVELRERHGRVGERIVEEVVSALFLVVDAVEGEPAVGGANTSRVLGQGGYPEA